MTINVTIGSTQNYDQSNHPPCEKYYDHKYLYCFYNVFNVYKLSRNELRHQLYYHRDYMVQSLNIDPIVLRPNHHQKEGQIKATPTTTLVGERQ